MSNGRVFNLIESNSGFVITFARRCGLGFSLNFIVGYAHLEFGQCHWCGINCIVKTRWRAEAALNGLPIEGYLALLAAFLVLAVTLTPLAVAAALRLAVGG